MTKHDIRQSLISMYEADWRKQALKVQCPTCDAGVDQRCVTYTVLTSSKGGAKTKSGGVKTRKPVGTVNYVTHKSRIRHGKNVFLLGGDDDE